MPGPNTLGIMTQIKTFLDGLGLYTTTVIGLERDWTGVVPIAEIMWIDDKSENWEMGGFKRDTQGFRVSTGVSLTEQTPLAAVTQLCTLRDAIVPLFQQHAYLGGIAGVDDSRVRPSTMRIIPMTLNGNLYLVHELVVEVCTVYGVPTGAQGI